MWLTHPWPAHLFVLVIEEFLFTLEVEFVFLRFTRWTRPLLLSALSWTTAPEMRTSLHKSTRTASQRSPSSFLSTKRRERWPERSNRSRWESVCSHTVIYSTKCGSWGIYRVDSYRWPYEWSVEWKGVHKSPQIMFLVNNVWHFALVWKIHAWYKDIGSTMRRILYLRESKLLSF